MRKDVESFNFDPFDPKGERGRKALGNDSVNAGDILDIFSRIIFSRLQLYHPPINFLFGVLSTQFEDPLKICSPLTLKAVLAVLKPERLKADRARTQRDTFANHKVNTVNSSLNAVKGNWDTAVKASADYQEFKGGSVAFGGSNGRITGKGTIKAGMLDFEDVYYVEELKHYNLFSVSQMCEKKNKVLFTDIDCLVLSSDFKLPDENQVLLKILRQHNMYNFNLKNIDPSGDLSCLFANASIYESNKWYRRLGHVNFKNLNKLVKENLVRGLPSKIFENDHTCVSCQKGKQHKASCKAKTVSSVNQPLQILHMDLFGPTSVHKKLTIVQSSEDKIEKNEKPVSQVEKIFQEELEKLKRQEKEANDAVRKEATHDSQDANTNITNLLNAVNVPVSTVGPSRALNDDEPSYPGDPSMPHLEDIFASPNPKFPNKVYKVVKALYGLHQAPRAWYATLSTFLERRQPKLGLWYPKVSSFDMEAYSDSDYAGVNLDRKSTTKGCQFLGRRLISWLRKLLPDFKLIIRFQYFIRGRCRKASVKEITVPNEVTDPVLGFPNPASQCHTCGAKDYRIGK
nr:putative ribonuclease H-like domain-containing protein [Tanacetum cinerariifolium]